MRSIQTFTAALTIILALLAATLWGGMAVASYTTAVAQACDGLREGKRDCQVAYRANRDAAAARAAGERVERAERMREARQAGAARLVERIAMQLEAEGCRVERDAPGSATLLGC